LRSGPYAAFRGTASPQLIQGSAVTGASRSAAAITAHSSRDNAAAGNTNAMPPLTALPRPSANGHQIPRDADSQGFVGYPGARCKYTNPAVVMGRTADSVVVICQTGVGRFYIDLSGSGSV